MGQVNFKERSLGGIQQLTFVDDTGQHCSISTHDGTSRLVITPYKKGNSLTFTAMGLSPELVGELVPFLQEFAACGKLAKRPIPEDK